jgi:hypothetical protein
VCNGTSATLSASGAGIVSWYSADTGGIYLSGNQQYLTPPLTTASTYYAQDSTCGGTARTPISIVVDSLPSAPVITSTYTVCSGNNTTVSASGGGTLGWYNASSGGTYLGGGNSYITPALYTNSTYYAQDSSNCGASVRTEVKVIVDSMHALVIYAAGDTFTANAYASYQWYYYDIAIANATQQTYIATKAGQYFLVVTSAQGCSDTSAYFFVGGGILGNNLQNNISLYPNPCNGTFILETSNAIDKQFIIYDVLGNEVLNQTITSDKQIVNLNHAAPGIYYVSLLGDGPMYTGKLVVGAQ